jgi:hypothetical protein
LVHILYGTAINQNRRGVFLRKEGFFSKIRKNFSEKFKDKAAKNSSACVPNVRKAGDANNSVC